MLFGLTSGSPKTAYLARSTQLAISNLADLASFNRTDKTCLLRPTTLWIIVFTSPFTSTRCSSHQHGFVQTERRVGDLLDPCQAQRVFLRLLSERTLCKRGVCALHASASHVLRSQRDPSLHHDVSAAALSLLLHPRTKGLDKITTQISSCSTQKPV